jgi:hypothetical protein
MEENYMTKKIKLVYYTETKGFPEVKISKSKAYEICQRFGKDVTELEDPDNGEVLCSPSVRVWAEEA